MCARPGGRTIRSDIKASADLVVIDAPCTGTGTWRRNPDAKWRMRPGALEVRIKDQVEVLDRAAGLVKPGGRIAYITCSVLPQENNEQVSIHRASSRLCGGSAGAGHVGALGQGG
jgi:16S rRNA (cytosine967-C5)-methyltransferase